MQMALYPALAGTCRPATSSVRYQGSSQPSICQTPSFQYAMARIELLPRTHDLSACYCPRLPAQLSQLPHQRRFVFRAEGCSRKCCRSICCSYVGRNRSFSCCRSAQIKAHSAHRSHWRRKLTETLLSTCNLSAAQPGRSRPRCREVFLRLARSQYREALPRQSPHCRNHLTSVAVRNA